MSETKLQLRALDSRNKLLDRRIQSLSQELQISREKATVASLAAEEKSGCVADLTAERAELKAQAEMYRDQLSERCDYRLITSTCSLMQSFSSNICNTGDLLFFFQNISKNSIHAVVAILVRFSDCKSVPITTTHNIPSTNVCQYTQAGNKNRKLEIRAPKAGQAHSRATKKYLLPCGSITS